MRRIEQTAHNKKVIDMIIEAMSGCWRPKSYQFMIDLLNESRIYSSTGNKWTRKSLFRMLQRQGYSGLHGLLKELQV